jgi:hypothetical protein
VPVPPPAAALTAAPGELLLVLEGASGPVYGAVRDGLRADAEVTRVLPVEFSGGRAALGVATALAPADLLARLRAALPDLRIEEVGPPQGRVLVVRAEPAPPPEPAPSPPGEAAASPAPDAQPGPERFDTQ